MCEENPMKIRQKIMNRILIGVAVVALVITAFEIGTWYAVKNQFAEPLHYNFTVSCPFMGADQKLCTCIESGLVSEYGKTLKNANINQQTIDAVLQGCLK
jgi:hypothetical protein